MASITNFLDSQAKKRIDSYEKVVQRSENPGFIERLFTNISGKSSRQWMETGISGALLASSYKRLGKISDQNYDKNSLSDTGVSDYKNITLGITRIKELKTDIGPVDKKIGNKFTQSVENFNKPGETGITKQSLQPIFSSIQSEFKRINSVNDKFKQSIENSNSIVKEHLIKRDSEIEQIDSRIKQSVDEIQTKFEETDSTLRSIRSKLTNLENQLQSQARNKSSNESSNESAPATRSIQQGSQGLSALDLAALAGGSTAAAKLGKSAETSGAAKLGKLAGRTLAVAGAGLEAYNTYEETGSVGEAAAAGGGALAGALAGAASGAALGTAIAPGAGTIVGTGLGLIGGYLGSVAGSWGARKGYNYLANQQKDVVKTQPSGSEDFSDPEGAFPVTSGGKVIAYHHKGGGFVVRPGYEDEFKRFQSATRTTLSTDKQLSQPNVNTSSYPTGLTDTTKGSNQVRGYLNRARLRQSTKPQSKGLLGGLGGFAGYGGFPTPTQSDKILTPSDIYAREQVEAQKSQFIKFGQLPPGFEFMPGHMGRLGQPEAVAATGAMPLGGYGGVPGVPGMPSGGYATGGGAAAGYTTGPTANRGAETTFGPEIQPSTGGPQFASPIPAHSRSRMAEGFKTPEGMKVDRSQFDEQMKNPAVRAALAARAEIEVGTQPGAQLKWMESVFNRAQSRGLTIMQAVNNHDGYYPSKDNERWANLSRQPGISGRWNGLMNTVHIEGSNESRGATGNESGPVRSSGAPLVSSGGGERFPIENIDLKKGWKPTFIKKEPGTTSTTAPQQQQQSQNQQTNAPVTQDFQQFTLRGKAFPPPMRLGGPTVTNSANTDNGPSRFFFDVNRMYSNDEIIQMQQQHGKNIVIGGNAMTDEYQDFQRRVQEAGSLPHAYYVGRGEPAAGYGGQGVKFSSDQDEVAAAIQEMRSKGGKYANMDRKQWDAGGWVDWHRQKLMQDKPYQFEWDSIPHQGNPEAFRKFLHEHQTWARDNNVSSRMMFKNFTPDDWRMVKGEFDKFKASGGREGLDPKLFGRFGFTEGYQSQNDRAENTRIGAQVGVGVASAPNEKASDYYASPGGTETEIGVGIPGVRSPYEGGPPYTGPTSADNITLSGASLVQQYEASRFNIFKPTTEFQAPSPNKRSQYGWITSQSDRNWNQCVALSKAFNPGVGSASSWRVDLNTPIVPGSMVATSRYGKGATPGGAPGSGYHTGIALTSPDKNGNFLILDQHAGATGQAKVRMINRFNYQGFSDATFGVVKGTKPSMAALQAALGLAKNNDYAKEIQKSIETLQTTGKSPTLPNQSQESALGISNEELAKNIASHIGVTIDQPRPDMPGTQTVRSPWDQPSLGAAGGPSPGAAGVIPQVAQIIQPVPQTIPGALLPSFTGINQSQSTSTPVPATEPAAPTATAPEPVAPAAPAAPAAAPAAAAAAPAATGIPSIDRVNRPSGWDGVTPPGVTPSSVVPQQQPVKVQQPSVSGIYSGTTAPAPRGPETPAPPESPMAAAKRSTGAVEVPEGRKSPGGATGNTSKNGFQHNPESQAAQPGSGGYGSYGRCFINFVGFIISSSYVSDNILTFLQLLK